MAGFHRRRPPSRQKDREADARAPGRRGPSGRPRPPGALPSRLTALGGARRRLKARRRGSSRRPPVAVDGAPPWPKPAPSCGDRRSRPPIKACGWGLDMVGEGVPGQWGETRG
jgi:hypothetical protein